MRWDHPLPDEWCTPNGAIVILTAHNCKGFEIKCRINRRNYRWVTDDQDDIHLFETLRQAKSFARKELV